MIQETYHEVRKPRIGQWVRDELFDHDIFTTWVDPENRKVFVCARGSKLTRSNLELDLDVLLGRSTNTASEIEQYLDSVSTEYRGYHLGIGAHSLGCYELLELISEKIKKEFATIFLFNPPYVITNNQLAKYAITDNRITLFLNIADVVCSLFTTHSR